MRRHVVLGGVAFLLLVMPCTPAASQERETVPRSGYRAASSLAQMRECHVRALSEGLSLDSAQLAALRDAIAQYRDTVGPTPSRMEWVKRTQVRDSTVLTQLRTGRDSTQFRRNSRAEPQWFRAGNCNGGFP